MARSGSVDFTRTRNEIINAAYRKNRVLGEGQTLSGWKVTVASEALDLMLKSWMSHGIHLWKILDAAVFLVDSQAEYTLGSGTSAARWASTWVKTELSAAAVETDTTLTVDDDDGISDGDILGLVLDDDTVHWTTVDGTPAANVITIDDAITGDAAINQHVYAFTSRANRPLRVLAGRVVYDGGNEVPVRVMSRQEYNDIPNKTTAGKIHSIYYDPKLDNGTLKVWNTPDTPQDYLIITYETPIEDMDRVSHEADFPIEWYEAIVYGLAERLAPECGLPAQERTLLKQEAKEKLEEVRGFDQEITSVFFRRKPDFRRGFRSRMP